MTRQSVVFRSLTGADAGAAVSGFQVIVRAVPGTNPLEPVEDAIRQIDANLSSFSPASVAEAVERMSEVTRRSVLMYAGIGVFGLVIVAVGLPASRHSPWFIGRKKLRFASRSVRRGPAS